MKTLLWIKSSIFGDNGVSAHAAASYVSRWQESHPEGRVVVRDVGTEPLPHFDMTRIGAIMTPADQRSPEQQKIADGADALIAELRDADVLVLGLPMYNFSLPSQLKAYFDHVARAGVTFRYTANGPEGLLPDRPTYVFAARGGMYQGTPLDTQTPLVKAFLGFIGIRDVQFVYIEGVNLSPEQKATALEAARVEAGALAA